MTFNGHQTTALVSSVLVSSAFAIPERYLNHPTFGMLYRV
ncbi:MAG: hypothetical protein ACI9IO_002213, partial [Cyanobium sp.]